jgi:hypothetical protein
MQLHYSLLHFPYAPAADAQHPPRRRPRRAAAAGQPRQPARRAAAPTPFKGSGSHRTLSVGCCWGLAEIGTLAACACGTAQRDRRPWSLRLGQPCPRPYCPGHCRHRPVGARQTSAGRPQQQHDERSKQTLGDAAGRGMTQHRTQGRAGHATRDAADATYRRSNP